MAEYGLGTDVGRMMDPPRAPTRSGISLMTDGIASLSMFPPTDLGGSAFGRKSSWPTGEELKAKPLTAPFQDRSWGDLDRRTVFTESATVSSDAHLDLKRKVDLLSAKLNEMKFMLDEVCQKSKRLESKIFERDLNIVELQEKVHILERSSAAQKVARVPQEPPEEAQRPFVNPPGYGLSAAASPFVSASSPAVKPSAPSVSPSPQVGFSSIFDTVSVSVDSFVKVNPALSELTSDAYVLDFNDKRVNRILATLPGEETSNPIAALINFCKHQLKFDVDFKSFESNSGMHHVQLFFMNDLICEAADRKKKLAREVVAKEGLKILNTNKDLLFKWVHYALTKQ